MKSFSSQVHWAPYRGYYVLWYGRLVNRLDGRIRLFNSEGEACAFLEQCEAAGRVIQNEPTRSEPLRPSENVAAAV